MCDHVYDCAFLCGARDVWIGKIPLPHVQIMFAEMWDKFLAKLSDYQILRKKNAAYSYLSDFYPVT